MSDRELDDLFREAVVQYTLPELAQKEAVWKKLEEQLDVPATQESKPFIRET